MSASLCVSDEFLSFLALAGRLTYLLNSDSEAWLKTKLPNVRIASRRATCCLLVGVLKAFTLNILTYNNFTYLHVQLTVARCLLGCSVF